MLQLLHHILDDKAVNSTMFQNSLNT